MRVELRGDVAGSTEGSLGNQPQELATSSQGKARGPAPPDVSPPPDDATKPLNHRSMRASTPDSCSLGDSVGIAEDGRGTAATSSEEALSEDSLASHEGAGGGAGKGANGGRETAAAQAPRAKGPRRAAVQQGVVNGKPPGRVPPVMLLLAGLPGSGRFACRSVPCSSEGQYLYRIPVASSLRLSQKSKHARAVERCTGMRTGGCSAVIARVRRLPRPERRQEHFQPGPAGQVSRVVGAHQPGKDHAASFAGVAVTTSKRINLALALRCWWVAGHLGTCLLPRHQVSCHL